MALNAVNSSGTQAATQNPQDSAQSSGGGTQSSSVQPGTSTSLLTTNNGALPLAGGNLTTVSLGTRTGQVISNPPVKHHHANPALVGLSVALFLVAVVMFWTTTRSAKITTD